MEDFIMSIRSFASALVLIAMVAAPAVAADKDKDKDRGHPPAAQGNAPHPGNAPKPDGRHDNGRHVGWQKQAWKRGDRIPLASLEPVYYVKDYRTYRLPAPPPGHRWVRPMDGRYLLIEAATGLIVNAMGY
jgi:Ni/Co efflux regulator RcnB